jgi:hypothetical protein
MNKMNDYRSSKTARRALFISKFALFVATLAFLLAVFQ